MRNDLIAFDNGWEFCLGPQDNCSIPESGWKKVDLPHDFSIEGSYDRDCDADRRCGFLPGGIGWYRKHFNLDRESLELSGWQEKKVEIHFDGVYMNAQVWLNDRLLGEHHYGYTSFSFDLTKDLQLGENIITVKADNSKNPSGRWYTGSGIYRHVWISARSRTRIDREKVYIWQAEGSDHRPMLIAESAVISDIQEPCGILRINYRLFDPKRDLTASGFIDDAIPGQVCPVALTPSAV
ncbi:MAG TPA: hypothetical protein DCY35_09495, partial [Prolixibacteraceae bacterium]|nr:hypothetical protein [Prolixibacteraceae bacterium]